MFGIYRLVRRAAMLAALVAFVPVPAKAQLGGNGDMMQQMAPMLEMMKARMGKRRFAKLIQTMGPMMSGMTENGALSGMMGGGLGDLGAPAIAAPTYATPGFEGQGFVASNSSASGSGGFGMGGIGMGGIGMGGFDAGQMMTMIPQMVSFADMAGSRHHRKTHRRRR